MEQEERNSEKFVYGIKNGSGGVWEYKFIRTRKAVKTE